MSKCPEKPSSKEMVELLKARSHNKPKGSKYLVVCRIDKVADDVEPNALKCPGERLKSLPHRNGDEAEDNEIEVKIAASGILFPGILDSGTAATIIPMSIAMK